jgi:hypothetical protein
MQHILALHFVVVLRQLNQAIHVIAFLPSPKKMLISFISLDYFFFAMSGWTSMKWVVVNLGLTYS